MREFTFERLDVDFDEDEYLEARRLFRIAAGLIEPTEENAEYERGMAELITERIGLPLGDYSGAVLEQILHDAGRKVCPTCKGHKVVQRDVGHRTINVLCFCKQGRGAQ